MTQTAVKWLVNVVQSCIAPNFIPKEIVNQANKMHEQQIIDAYNEGGCNWDSELEAEQYYNDTFKK